MCAKCVDKIVETGNADAASVEIVCARCHVLRSTASFAEEMLQQSRKLWICKSCDALPKIVDPRSCTRCRKKLRDIDFDKDAQGYYNSVCRECKQTECTNRKKKCFCGRCQKNLQEVDFDRDSSRNLYTVCRACQHPTCSICRTTRASIWTPSPKVKKPVALCDACESKRTCGLCERRLDLSAFDRSSSRNLYNHCRECQYPVCDLCGQKRKSIWTPSPKTVDAPPLCESCESKSTKRKRK